MEYHSLSVKHDDGSPITKSQFEKIIQKAVTKAVDKKCRFPISDEHAKETSHLYGMISDLGDGNMSNGIEEARKNHSYVKKIRAKSDKFSTYFFMIIIAGLTGGVLKVIWTGIKSIAVDK